MLIVSPYRKRIHRGIRFNHLLLCWMDVNACRSHFHCSHLRMLSSSHSGCNLWRSRYAQRLQASIWMPSSWIHLPKDDCAPPHRCGILCDNCQAQHGPTQNNQRCVSALAPKNLIDDKKHVGSAYWICHFNPWQSHTYSIPQHPRIPQSNLHAIGHPQWQMLHWLKNHLSTQDAHPTEFGACFVPERMACHDDRACIMMARFGAPLFRQPSAPHHTDFFARRARSTEKYMQVSRIEWYLVLFELSICIHFSLLYPILGYTVHAYLRLSHATSC